MFSRHAIQIEVVGSVTFLRGHCNLIPRRERLLQGKVRFNGLLDLVKRIGELPAASVNTSRQHTQKTGTSALMSASP